MVKGLRYGLACLFLIGCDRFQGEQELLIADELETIAIRSSSDAVAKIPAASFELQPWPRLDTPPEVEATIGWEEARDWVGKVVAVEGEIVRVHNSGKACFLGFGPYEEKTFTAVIFASSFGDYSAPPEALFADHKVRVSGRIKIYRDIPEIIVESPAQLVVLDS